ncbi:hypothetical protein SISSUDRAFT_1055338, partial [Sistotremastrum suecicum HHB10207 ss-3]
MFPPRDKSSLYLHVNKELPDVAKTPQASMMNVLAHVTMREKRYEIRLSENCNKCETFFTAEQMSTSQVLDACVMGRSREGRVWVTRMRQRLVTWGEDTVEVIKKACPAVNAIHSSSSGCTLGPRIRLHSKSAPPSNSQPSTRLSL